MSGFFDGVTERGIADAQDGFPQFAIGDNVAFIDNVKETTSKNSGKPMLEITFQTDAGAAIKHHIVDGEWKLVNLKKLMVAFRIPMGETDVAMWLHKRGIVVCKEDVYQGNTYPKVSYFKQVGATTGGIPRQSNPSASAPASSASMPKANDCFDDDIPF